MRLLFNLIKAYPWRTALALLALLLAGISDALSITALLPLLNIVTREAAIDPAAQSMPAGPENNLEAFVLNTLDTLGIEATLGVLLVIIVSAISLKTLLMFASAVHVGYSSAHITTDLRLALLRAVLSTRWSWFLHQPIGKLANAMAGESRRSASSYVYGINMLAFIIQSIVYAVLALAMSWQATGAILGIGLITLATSHLLVRMSRRAGKRQTKLSKSLLSRLTDTLQSVKSLKAMAREELADSVLSTETSKLNKALQHQVLSQESLSAVQTLIFTCVIATGIYLALEHWNMQLTTIMVLVFLFFRILNQLGKVQKTYQKMITHESAYWSIMNTINKAEHDRETFTGTLPPNLEHCIRFNSVSFSYDDKHILEDVTFEIPTRSLTTIIGSSGAGKTTLIDLIIGLYQPDEGTILLDDVPLINIDLKQWRQKVGYVPQEQVLLHDSILTNVTFGDPALRRDDAERALRSAGAWEFVSKMPNGMDSNVGERGARLSGGQRQRIMIARGLAHQPEMLILDEPTSALDPTSEALIRDTLQELRKSYTIIVITHQATLADVADNTWQLKNGKLVTINIPTDNP